jgi:hypothetical protein
VPITEAAYATARSCAARVAASTAGDSARPIVGTSVPRLPATVQRAPFRTSCSRATPTLSDQFFGCITSAPPIVVSASCRCECPKITRSTPCTSRATRADTFSPGSRASVVS